MLRRRCCAAASALTLLAAACSWSTTVTERPCSGADVHATVATAGPASVTWTPFCGLRDVRVVEATTTAPVQWEVIANGRLIFPDVRYGQVPDGAMAYIGPQPLTSGHTYRMELLTVDGTTPITITWTP